MNPWIIRGVAFGALLGLFSLTYGYYPPAQLVITGEVQHAEALELRWDDGGGFDPRLSYPFTLEPGAGPRVIRLPQTAVERIEIRAADQPTSFVLTRLELRTGGEQREISTGDSPVTRSELHWILLLVQCLVAGVAVALGTFAWRERRRLRPSKWFVGFFTVAVVVYATWLLGQWPGAMTNDSLSQWQQMKSLELSNAIPWIYSLMVLAAVQLADTPAVVAIAQILATAGIGAAIFATCVRRGAPWYTVVPFFLLFAFSIPIGLYSITLWKDVPFAILILAASFGLYWLGLRRRSGEAAVALSWPQALVGGGLLFLFMVRHNGIVFLALIPVVLVAARAVTVRGGLRLAGATLLVFVGMQYGAATAMGVHERTDYRVMDFWVRANPVFGLFAHRRGYFTPDPIGDRAIVERVVPIEGIERHYNPAHVGSVYYKFRSVEGREHYPEIAELFFERVPDNLAIFASDRLYLVLSALGLSRDAYIWSNPLQRGAFLDAKVWEARAQRSPWKNQTSLFYLQGSPVVSGLADFHDDWIGPLTYYGGLSRGRFVFCNSLFPLMALVLALILRRRYPATALFALLPVVQAVLVAAVATASDYRFFYFVHLSGIFVIPLAIAEGAVARRTSTGTFRGPLHGLATVGRAALNAAVMKYRALARRSRPFGETVGRVVLFPTVDPGHGLLDRARWYAADSVEVTGQAAQWRDDDLILVHCWPQLRKLHTAQIARAEIVDPYYYGYTEAVAWAELQYRTLPQAERDALREHSAGLFRKVLAQHAGRDVAYVVGTGPSLERLVDLELAGGGLRVACNSVVKDPELFARIAPQILTFADPVFHFGPSQYARAFRDHLARACTTHEFAVVVPERFAPILVKHVPETRGRVIGMPIVAGDTPRWPTADDPRVTGTDNIMTLFMVPIATAIARDVRILGADGRAPTETYFWRHAQSAQLGDLLQSAFEAHPSFFRDRDYAGYYDAHCRHLAQQLAAGEARGARYRSITPSYIPALRERYEG